MNKTISVKFEDQTPLDVEVVGEYSPKDGFALHTVWLQVGKKRFDITDAVSKHELDALAMNGLEYGRDDWYEENKEYDEDID